MESNNKRVKYIDCVKGIAIILVAVIHSISNFPDLTQVEQIYLLRFCTLFAMPTFFLLNGYLYNDKYSKRPLWAIVKKIKAYYIPFVEYNVAYVIFHNLFAYMHLVDADYGNGPYDVKQFFKHILLAVTGHRELFSGALWFLGSILTISVVFICIDCFAIKLEKGRYVVLTIATIIITIAGMSGHVPAAMKLEASCLNFLFFYIGFLFKRFEIFEKIDRYRTIIVVIAFVILFIVSLFSNLSIVCENQPGIYACGIVGAIMLIEFCKYDFIQNNRLINIIGSASLEIMALHFLAFKVVSFMAVSYYGYSIARMAEYPVIVLLDGGWWILYSIAGISLPTLFKLGMDKVKAKGSELCHK